MSAQSVKNHANMSAILVLFLLLTSLDSGAALSRKLWLDFGFLLLVHEVVGIHIELQTSQDGLCCVNIPGSPSIYEKLLAVSTEAASLPSEMNQTERRTDKNYSRRVCLCVDVRLVSMKEKAPRLRIPHRFTSFLPENHSRHLHRVENWSDSRNVINLAQLDAWFMRKTKPWRSEA